MMWVAVIRILPRYEGMVCTIEALYGFIDFQYEITSHVTLTTLRNSRSG